MGCSTSKLDDLPAVALCRNRCESLDEAIRLRYALADAHLAYVQSLKEVGHSLHSFIEQVFVDSSGSPSSPRLNLPPQEKNGSIGATTAKASATSPHHSHSNSSSELQFHSDPEYQSGSLHHSDHSSPAQYYTGDHIGYMSGDQEGLVPYGDIGGGSMHMNYTKNKAMTSVPHEQRPVDTEKAYQMGESSPPTAHYSYPYSNSNSYPYPSCEYTNYGGGDGGRYGSSPSPPGYGTSISLPAHASSSKPPPPPPSPPTASPWDFLSIFESSDYYTAYTPSRDSKEVRDEEGIPDLEDDYRHEVVNELHGDKKLLGNGGEKQPKSEVDDEIDYVIGSSISETRPRDVVENDGFEYEVHTVDEKIAGSEAWSEEDYGGTAFKDRIRSMDIFEVAKLIEVLFNGASDSGNEIAKMLEVGKLPYKRKHVSCNMLSYAIGCSCSSLAYEGAELSPYTDKAGAAEMDFGEGMGIRPESLSSSLQKLYLWEKKLYDEVKAEEKMRIIHERKYRKLKELDVNGAEAQKLDSARNLIRSLSTKIRIAIQIVDKISVTINKIRDEELWPQLCQLIQGLSRMWRCMLESHRTQYRAVKEAKGFGLISSGKWLSDAHLEATSQLGRDLINWTSRFSSWISAQKGFVRALNNWLLKCFMYVPQVTDDGIVPFSPGRMGAPAVFVICNQWARSLENISEKEVVDTMRVCTMIVASQTDSGSLSLQAIPQRVFEAMERFAANSAKTYEEILQRCEELNHKG